MRYKREGIRSKINKTTWNAGAKGKEEKVKWKKQVQGRHREEDFFRKNSGTKRCMVRKRVSWEFRSEGYTSKEETIIGVANHLNSLGERRL
jgi:hypothetical protein